MIDAIYGRFPLTVGLRLSLSLGLRAKGGLLYFGSHGPFRILLKSAGDEASTMSFHANSV